MAQITVHKQPGVEVVVIDGDPPVDQSAEVASLQAAVAQAAQARATALAERDAAVAGLRALKTAVDAANTL